MITIARASDLVLLRSNLSERAVLTQNIDLSATMMAAPAWQTATVYRQYQVVRNTSLSQIFRCTQDHTSGTFADDLAAGRWSYVRDFVPTYSSSSTYAVGDEVVHEGGIYQCITAITEPEPFTPSKWAQLGTTEVGWMVIGPTSGSPFTGQLDADGYCISNLCYTMSAGNDVGGLFGYLGYPANIRRLYLDGFSLLHVSGGTGTSGSSGTLAAYANDSNLQWNLCEDIHVSRSYVRARHTSSGVIGRGRNIYYTSMRRCSFEGVIEATLSTAFLGGLIAQMASLPGGGIFESVSNARIIGSSSSQHAGGIAAPYSSDVSYANVYDSVFCGRFQGTFGTAGGISGPELGQEQTIQNCLNVGTNQVSSGLVYGINASTGINIKNSYYIQSFGTLEVPHLRRKAPTELKMRSTYTDWDFKKIWYLPPTQNIDSPFNNGYPMLRSFIDISSSGLSSFSVRSRYSYAG